MKGNEGKAVALAGRPFDELRAMPDRLDVSLPAIQVARAVDRLGPGEYIIRLVKPEFPGEAWAVEIARAETVQRLKVGGRKQ